VLASILDVASHVGYPIVFLLIAVETIGVPVPGETALVLAAIAAGRGQLSIEAVIAVAALAAIVGDNIGFALGRKLGLDPAEVEAHVQRLVVSARQGLLDGSARDVDPAAI